MAVDEPPVPNAEERRLAALARYEVAGTPPEATFDRVVAIAAAVFDAQVAMITLVDEDRCWYKAEVGMGQPHLPRADNMCDAVIRQDAVFVINDAHTQSEGLVAPLLKQGMRWYMGAPLRTQDGVNIGTLCVVDPRPREVTEREKRILADLASIVVDELELRLAARRIDEADRELRRVNKELEVASANKSEFLASMSHELRTPLNGVLGAAELLEQGIHGPLNQRQQEYIADIRRSGLHLLSLIDDILDISRVEAGQVDLRLETLPVPAVMDGCVAFIRGFAEARSIDLVVEAPAAPLSIVADERRTTQVGCNLLMNAVKFTPEGGRVTFRAWREGDQVVFAVEDTGPGIEPEYHERIFDQFFRVPGDQEGTGLGLPLARRLAESQGGRTWLESEPGAGSRFYFSLPLAAGQASSP